MSKFYEVTWHPGPFTVHASTEKEAKAIAAEHLLAHMKAQLVEKKYESIQESGEPK